MKSLMLSVVILLTATAARAETVTLLDGTTLTEVTITKVEPHQITCMNSDGIKKIPLEKLSPELQAKYGYDATKAAAYQEEQKAISQAAQAKLAANLAKDREDIAKNPSMSHAGIPTAPAGAAPAQAPTVTQDGNVEALRKQLYTELMNWAKTRKPASGKSNGMWLWSTTSKSHSIQMGEPIETTVWMRTMDAGLYKARSLADEIKVSQFRQ